MSLMDRILSSRTAVSAYAVQPYKAVTDTPAYGNRFISPVVNAPAVLDIALSAAPAGSTVRGNNPTMSKPGPLVIRNGVAPTSGNNAPRRGW